jgi:restriction system protein
MRGAAAPHGFKKPLEYYWVEYAVVLFARHIAKTWGGMMARSTSSALLDDRVELPWWVGVVIAAIIYVFLKWVFPLVAGSNEFLAQLAATAQSSAGLLALIFLALASLSLFLAYRRRRLLDLEVSLATIRALPQRRFEQFVAEAFQNQGYSVSETGSAGDCGVDFILRRGNEKVLIQCRRWRSETIDIAPVRGLYDVIAAEHASGCAVLTTGGYSSEAFRFAAGKPVRLIAGPELEKMLRGVKRAVASAEAAPAHESSLS